jgi:hypothetical protein
MLFFKFYTIVLFYNNLRLNLSFFKDEISVIGLPPKLQSGVFRYCPGNEILP